MKQFIDTWSKAAPNLSAFWTMMFIVMLSYAAMGYVLFGTRLSQFKTFSESTMSMLQYMVASYNMEEMERDIGTIGVVYTLVFIMMCYFVMMNIPMIILGEAYDQLM